jgi:plastocyanin
VLRKSSTYERRESSLSEYKARIVLFSLVAIIVAVGAGAAILALPSTTSKSQSAVSSTTPSFDPRSVKIDIASGSGGVGTPRNDTFEPDSALVVLGYNATVIWYNADSVIHTVTANQSDASLDAGFVAFGPTNGSFNNIEPGQAAVFTFTKPGIYGYFDSYHSWVIGTIIVVPASCKTNASACFVTTGSATAATTTFYRTGAYPTLTITAQTIEVLVYVPECTTVSGVTSTTFVSPVGAQTTTVSYILPSNLTETGIVSLVTVTNSTVVESSRTQTESITC